MNTETAIYFELVTGFIGNGIPNSFATETFKTYEEAEAYFKREYTNRKKNDGYDEYWNKKPLCVRSVTKVITIFY